MRKLRKIGILFILLAVVLSALYFINIQKVYAEPNNPLSGDISHVEKSNCDGRELNEFVLSGAYSMTESGSGFLVNLSISGGTVNGIKSIGNTTSWAKQIIFSVHGISSLQKIDGTTGGGISATISLPSARYNESYSLSITVSGTHGYIGHGNHGWSMTASTSVSWSKGTPTLALRGVSNNGYTNADVTVSSPTADATIEYRHNSAAPTYVASDSYSQSFTAEGNHSFVIYNNDDALGTHSEYSFIIDKTAPTGTLTGVSDKGYTNANVSLTWSDATSEQSPITAMLNGNSYIKGTSITAEGKHTIVLKDAAGNSSTYTFIIDKTNPIGTLNGVANNGYTNGNVSLSWESASKVQSPISASLNGANYTSGKLISAEGRHTIVLSDEAGNSSIYIFTIDKTAPTGTLTGVSDKGYTNTNVSLTWSDATSEQSPITVMLNDSTYIKGTSITAEGKHTIVLKDTAGNSRTYTFIIDKTNPIGTLNGVANGGITGGDVSFTWASPSTTESPIVSVTRNGVAYVHSMVISASGRHTIVITDAAGNFTTYTFTIDKLRPYITNLSDIKSIFALNDTQSNRLGQGQTGSYECDLGRALPGILFAFADEYSDFNIKISKSSYKYDLVTGKYNVSAPIGYEAFSSIKIIDPGEYSITVTDSFSTALTLRFTIGVDVVFDPTAFVLKETRYILGNEDISHIISMSVANNQSGATIFIGDIDTNKTSISLDELKQYLASYGERDKSARVRLISAHNGVSVTYYDHIIGYDFNGADIHNLADMTFEGGSGSYLGLSRTGITLEFGALVAELAETATLVQILYSYDARNVLIAKDEQTIAYSSGLLIPHNGYYVLRITNGFRSTEFSFKILDEFRSSNEYMLKNEYFIAPQYNAVKLPLSFGNFKISSNSNVDNSYIGDYSAEKIYLFSADTATAYSFAFAAEYSVCVQKTSSGYLYRARNQGIQVAYNSIDQLSSKIREVVKDYVTYKALAISDSQSIDHHRHVIMDSEIIYNGAYRNVAPITIASTTYDRIMLINKSYVFNHNAGKDPLSNNYKIEITELLTNAKYTATSGVTFGSITELNGLYKIEEFYPGSDMQVIYYVYLDNVAPTADISSSKADGTNTDQTVTASDTIVLQIESFMLKTVLDMIDNYCMVLITGYGFTTAVPVQKGTFADIEVSAKLGHKGAYTVEVYDRSRNKFSFILYITGAPPTAIFTKSGSGDSEYVTLNISVPDRYCTVMDLQIYRNNNSLSADSDGTTIAPAILSYRFDRGGRYKIIIIDNFARTTIVELRYIKDMPNISTVGLNKERRVSGEVIITLPINALYTITAEHSSPISIDTSRDSSNGVIIITIKPRNEYNELLYIEDKITVKAWYEADPDSYNDLSYVLDTIAPVITITDENGEIISGQLFKIGVKLIYDQDVKTIEVMRNGRYFSYSAGQTIRLDGHYTATVRDIAGNSAVVELVVDMQVEFSINFENNKKYLSDIEVGVTVCAGFTLAALEQMTMLVTKDGYIIDLAFGKVLASGLYNITLQDNAGNNVHQLYRVISAISDIALHAESGDLLPYNTTTNQSIYLSWDEHSYIKSVTYRIGGSTIDYIKGELLTRSGIYIVQFTDVVGNYVEVRVVMDKEVSIEFKLDKQATLDDIDTLPNTLTLRFKLITDESGITLVIRRSDIILDYTVGTWISGNGIYLVTASDSHGNTITRYITVIGESLPAVSITTANGRELTDKAVVNEDIIISWTDIDYISKVTVAGNNIASGESIIHDGKYTIALTDLLDRERTFTVTKKTRIEYTINYSGSHSITDNGKIITLTRGFSFANSDELTVTATHNGEPIALTSYRLYSTPGDYYIIITDSATNREEHHIVVRDQAFLPTLRDSNNAQISWGSIISSPFTIDFDAFVATIHVGGNLYYKGDVISARGKHRVEIVDCIGNRSTQYINIDNTVDFTIAYGKRYDKSGVTLTDRFKITLNEPATVIMLYNGELIDYSNTPYANTGIYIFTITDLLSNSAHLTIEVDNRTPDIEVLDSRGELVIGNITNQSISFVWADNANIAEVKVNGVVIINGQGATDPLQYYIETVSLLGVRSTRTIIIKYDIVYDITYRGNSHQYTATDGTEYTICGGFSISGNTIVLITATRDGAEFSITLGNYIAQPGEYIVTITDNASNSKTLYINLSVAPISSGIIVGADTFNDSRTINASFTIRYNAFISAININGTRIADGTVFSQEGSYSIEYIDVLGRKTYSQINIDLTVSVTWEYSYIDDQVVYYHRFLQLTMREQVTVTVMLDGKELVDYDSSIALKLNGLCEVTVTDCVGNTISFKLLIDNLAPVILVSDLGESNHVKIAISDELAMKISVYLDDKLYLTDVAEFVLSINGKYRIIVIDALSNSLEQLVATDTLVDVTCDFFSGQSINIKPTFSTNEPVSYAMYYGTELVADYKLNGALALSGNYTIKFTDNRGNKLDISFNYLGASRKLAATKYYIPEGVTFAVTFNGGMLDISLTEGYLLLDESGEYIIVVTQGNRTLEYGLTIINQPPDLKLVGNFKSQDNLKAYGTVAIQCASDYVIYHNDIIISSQSSVSKIGRYKVVATDSVGNTKVMDFEIYYMPNGWSWLAIIIAAITVIIAVVAIIKRKGYFRKDKNKQTKRRKTHEH